MNSACQQASRVGAGPTCDSLDILYERDHYLLPADLRIGDQVDQLSTGACAASYSSVWFNGFEPLHSYHLPPTVEGAVL
jgi:ornithine decarboxylase